MTQSLDGKKVLVLVANGVDEGVMSAVQRDLLKAGAKIQTVGADASVVSSWNGAGWGLNFPTDAHVNVTLGADFDVLVVPAGERSTNTLIANPHSERIIASFEASRKPMCFIGNAARLLEATGHAAAAENSILAESVSEAVVRLFAAGAPVMPVAIKEAA